MTAFVHISAQTFENYGDDKSQQYWKAKGETIFEATVDDTILNYDSECFEKAIAELLATKWSNEQFKYEYRSHEIRFGRPVFIGDIGLEVESAYKEINKVANEQQ